MSETRPNIVLMVSDDHGREALGCYGNRAVSTPRLDELAAGGVRFTNAFCTTSSCSPSRSVILTGLHNHANGTYGLTHAKHHFWCHDGVRTLPVMLREAGYRTGRIGKKHYAPESLFPFEWNAGGAEFGRDDVRMSEACREFVRGSAPFFLYWCSNDPHRGGFVEPHPLRPNSFGNPGEAFPGDSERTFRPEEVTVPSFLPDTPEVRAELAQYYQSIARLDRGVGRLLDVLREEGRQKDTVIVYISDNGAAFPESKTTLYEPGMRLPCIVRSPLNSARGATCDGLVTWADLTPTILDFAGSREPAGQFHGKSFRPIIDEQSPSGWREEIYASHSFHEVTNYYPMRVVRTRRHKFIWNIAWKLDYTFAADLYRSASWQGALRDGLADFGRRSVEAYLHRPPFELYDLENDPDEIVNLAGRPECRELVGSFCEKIRVFQKETGDPWLHKWEYE
jgi:N-sulfoglucosamine sulfohydrolase